ncbi:hypothetical protein F2Q69_00054838 [Brassica cretica]|uniref:Uncharacterized protein n=1 Tax=Brassica cretica TaxID=69181 RepID=A0A8S9N822_BRACR|nr:hypothetical protein F2Q69_00054838 [Brassica cretica]
MYEGSEAKWVKAAERSNTRGAQHHGKHRGYSEGPGHRTYRREEVRSGDQETHTRPSSGQTRAQQNPIVTREEAREEGEFKVSDESSLNPPSQDFQLELARTQAEGTEVVSDPTDEGMGLQMVNGLFEEHEGRVEDDEMEMDALETNLLESGFDLGAEEDFQTLSEEEDEKALAKGDEVSVSSRKGAGSMQNRACATWLVRYVKYWHRVVIS